jgi:hypothetical protein
MPWLRNDNEFKKKYRMTKKQFDFVYTLIKDNPVFERKRKGRQQLPVRYQLAIFLRYLGSYGTGGSNENLHDLFRVGAGTCENARHRVLQSIIELGDRFLCWPNRDDRRLMGERMTLKHFPGCVGFVDGTIFFLQMKPEGPNAPDYYGRKGNSTLSTLIICSDDRRILFHHSGWAGSVHDSRIYKDTAMYQQPYDYFSEGEYIIGDSAFKNTNYMVTPYRKVKGQAELTRNKNRFNGRITHVRVVSEHTIGILKGRFLFLRCIPIRLRDHDDSLLTIVRYIEACCILHNVLHPSTPMEEMDRFRREHRDWELQNDNGDNNQQRQQWQHREREQQGGDIRRQILFNYMFPQER